MHKISIRYRVPYADADQMGVVYYANYFIYFERIRNEVIRSGGTSYQDVESQGLMFPVIEAHAEYAQSARYDQEINLSGWYVYAQGSRFRLDYEVQFEDTLLVTGHTIHCVVNKEGRPRRVPEFLLRQMPEKKS